MKKKRGGKHRRYLAFICLGLLSIKLASEPVFLFPVSFWYKNGFTLQESAEIARAGKEKETFQLWLDKLPDKKRKKILAVLLSNNVKLKIEKTKPSLNGLNTKSKTNATISIPKSRTNDESPDFFFVGGSYQILDTRYLPLDRRNHSSLFLGQSTSHTKWILEKRDTKFVYGFETHYSYFDLYLGNRYKPIQNFYFAKDADFFSNFDSNKSHLPQPLNESYFLGFKLNPNSTNSLFGVYSSKSVSEEPGLYLVSPEKKYSLTWAPYTRIGSLFINDSYTFGTTNVWRTNVQGEALGRSDNFVGFLYTRSQNQNGDIKIDATVYRDKDILAIPTSELFERNGTTQDLGYSRIRWKEYFALEALNSLQGLRVESGYGIHFPLLYGNYGALVVRYRDYKEDGLSKVNAAGRGLFYEYRNDKIIISIGGEDRDGFRQGEGKLSIPIYKTYFFEMSCLYRDQGIQLRSWFENWSFATDFNMNLVDRKEIWKLKFVGRDLSLNVSISERMDQATYIYYTNFQFNYRF